MTIATYARALATEINKISEVQESIKDIVSSAKDAGINPRVLRKVAREMCMDSDKRAKLYYDEEQLSLFRNEVGLTSSFAEAAE